MSIKELGIKLDTVEAGYIFDREACELLIGYSRDLKRYDWQLELMKICDRIQKELWKAGKQLTVVTTKSEIHVLTHEQASEYNSTRFDNAIKKMRRCYKRLVAVNTANFTDTLLQSHEKSIVKQSRILQAIKSNRAEIKVVPHNSGLPKRI